MQTPWQTEREVIPTIRLPGNGVMSTAFTQPPQSAIDYPDDDGQPMSDNTLQFKWIVLIKEGLETLFRHDPNVFVAGDLLWYPEEGNPKIRQAPDAMVVFGRPKGYRGSYKQWEEGGIAPQVVFEILSPGNRSAADAAQVPVLREVRGRGVLHLRSRDRQPGRLAPRRVVAWKRSTR